MRSHTVKGVCRVCSRSLLESAAMAEDATPISYRKSVLDNGLRVVTCRMAHTPSVGICLFVGVGSRHEMPELAGASHLVEHLLFKGTSRRPTPGEIGGTVEGVGGEINAATEQELTVYWCKAALPYMEECLDLLVDMAMGSVFDPEELERERMVVLEEQNQINDYPNDRVEAMLDDLLWPDHPLGRDVSGTRESISAMSREVVMEHYRGAYSPGNVVISAAGSVDHDTVVRQAESLTRDWPSGERPGWQPFCDGQDGARLGLEYRRTEQAHLSIGLPGLSLTHPDRYALDLLSMMLGDGMSSRLFMEVREKRGLAYDVHSSITSFMDCGALTIGAGVDPKKLYTAVETILAELGKLREGVPEDELERAKRRMGGRLLLRMEDSRAVAAWAGSQEAMLGEVVGVDEVMGLIAAITPGDVKRVANSLVASEKLNMAVVGPVRGRRRLEQAMAGAFAG